MNCDLVFALYSLFSILYSLFSILYSLFFQHSGLNPYFRTILNLKTEKTLEFRKEESNLPENLKTI